VNFRAALAALLLATLAAASASAEVARSGQPVMGTILTVTVIADGREAAQALADHALEEARRWDDALTIWRPDGELARLNERAGTGFVDIGPRLVRGLAAMLSLASATGGAFDPAVGALRLRDKRSVEPIRRALQLEGARASLTEGSLLDPGAIGKGLALDAIVELLRERGVTSAFLDFGGSSQTAIGVPPGDARGWSVLIAGSEPGSSHGIVKLRDASLSTSRAGAVDTTSILDPRSGAVVPAPRLATVIARDATAADAWSTALVVLGREGIAQAEKAGIEVLFEDGEGSVRTKSFVTEPVERGAS
jgi:FAD:protein FMN transferase